MFNACGYRSNDDKWTRSAFEVQRLYWQKNVHITLAEQISLTNSFKRELYSVRNECRVEIASVLQRINSWDCNSDNINSAYNMNVTKLFCEDVKRLSLKANVRMKLLAGKIIQESVELCGGIAPCKFAALALGSLAKGEATPYSDLEFMFLVEKKDDCITDYFELLAMTVYFLIGNIQETKLKYMNIAELKGFNDTCRNGFKIDGLQAKAGNIPTGNGTLEHRNKFILTVEELVDRYRYIYLNPNPADAVKGDFTSMLAHTAIIYGDNSLLKRFQIAQCNIEPNTARKSAHAEMIQTDIKDYDFTLYQLELQNQSADLKSAIYRFPSLLLYNLKIIYSISSQTSWQTLEKLHGTGRLSQGFFFMLRFLLASAVYIRLAAYLHYDSQNEKISFLKQSGSHTDVNSPNTGGFWHIPQPLVLHMSVKMITVKSSVSMRELDEILHTLTCDVKSNDRLTAAQVHYHSRNLVEALKILETQACESYAEKQMLAHCCLGLKRWTKFQLVVADILSSTNLSESPLPRYLHLYWTFKSATAFFQHGDIPQAKVKFEKVLKSIGNETSRGNMTDISILRVEVYLHAARFYLRLSDHGLAESYYVKGVELLETVPSDDVFGSSRLSLLVFQAAILIEMRRLSEAKAVLAEASEFCEVIYGKHACHITKASIYQALGNVYTLLEEYDKSLKFHEMAATMTEEFDPSTGESNNMGEQYVNLATVHTKQGKLTSAISWYQKALAKFEMGYGPKSHRVADTNCSMGLVFWLQDNYEDAGRYVQKAISICSAIDTQHMTNVVARCHFVMGLLLLDKGCRKDSLDQFRKVLTIRVPPVNIDHQDVLCETYSRIGDILYLDRNFKSAIPNYEKALSLLPRMSVLTADFVTAIFIKLSKCFARCFNQAKTHHWLVGAVRFLTRRESDYQKRETVCFLQVFACMVQDFKLWGVWTCSLQLSTDQDKPQLGGVEKFVTKCGKFLYL